MHPNNSVGHSPAQPYVGGHGASENAAPAKTGFFAKLAALPAAIGAAISNLFDRLFSCVWNKAPLKDDAARGAVALAHDYPPPAVEDLGSRSAQLLPTASDASPAKSALALHDVLQSDVSEGVAMMDARASDGDGVRAAAAEARSDTSAVLVHEAEVAPEAASLMDIDNLITRADDLILPEVSLGDAFAASRSASKRVIEGRDLGPSGLSDAHYRIVYGRDEASETPLPPDLMGEVGKFLDRHELRDLRNVYPSDSALKKVLDRPITKMELTPEEAVRHLGETGAYPNVTELRIVGWRTENLQPLAEVLAKRSSGKPIALELVSSGYGAQQDVSCLGPLNLSSLTLDRPKVGPDAPFSPGLVDAKFPIVLNDVQGESGEGLTSLLAFPTLTSLEMTNVRISEENAETIANHKSLTSINAFSTSAAGVRLMLQNPGLESVTLWRSRVGGTAAEEVAGLTTLDAGKELGQTVVETEQALVALAQSQTKETLQLEPMAEAVPAVRRLAYMPALNDLTLYNRREDGRAVYTANDVRALCAKEMRSLRFLNIPLNPEATELAAGANTKHLSLRNNVLNTKSMYALIGNDSITSLELRAETSEAIPKATWLALVRKPNLQQADIRTISSEVTADEISAAWTAAGKDEDKLYCRVLDPDDDD